MSNFRKLEVWQMSHKLTLEVYRITRNFPSDEKFGLTSQLRRACASIPTNIAEGSGQLTDANFIRYLGIARGSAFEVNYLLSLSKDLGYLNDEDYNRLIDITTRITKMIQGLIKTIK